MQLKKRNIIIAHDYLIQMGGAERVVVSLHRAFPQSKIYVSATDKKRLFSDLRNANIINTWMQFIPGIKTHFKKYFPVYPFAFKSFGKINADVAIVSSSGFAKWMRFTDQTKVFCYCYTPPRFFWQADNYLAFEVKSRFIKLIAKIIIPWLRTSDYNAAQKIQHFIAISNCVKQRILECYGRESVVIYPPVEVNRFETTPKNDGYYLVLSRLVSYKGIDRAIRAFTQNRKRLIVVGDGPDRERLQTMAGPRIEFKGQVNERAVKQYMENCYAFVFPGLEDFGISPVEAQSAGKPVLAFGKGGALETIIDGVTGMFFLDTSPEGVNEVIKRFETVSWNPDVIRANAERFAEQKFINAIMEYIESKL